MDEYLVKDGKFKKIIGKFNHKKIRYHTPPNTIFVTRKELLKLLYDDMWEKCPKCGCETVYIKIHKGEIGDSIHIICYECQHEEDVSHYELW